MPKMHHQQKLTDNLSLGVQIGQRAATSQGMWTARIKFPGFSPIFRTTGVKYESGSELSEREAIKKAYTIVSEYADKYSKGHNIENVNYIQTLVYGTRLVSRVRERKSYLEDMVEKAAENAKRKEPIYKYPGGKGYITPKKAKYLPTYWNKYLIPFVKTVPNTKYEASTTIEAMTKREWDRLDDYLALNHPDLAVNSRLQIITEARHFLYWCYEEGYVEDVPSIKRPHRGGVRGARQTMRREISPNDYLRIIQHTRDNYLDESRNTWERDFSYLFHLFILVLANTGIRPPTNGVPHTMIKWEDVKLDNTDNLRPTLRRLDEKGHSYDAIIMPQSVQYWMAIKKFYEDKGMSTKVGYVFKHWYNNKSLWQKGDPIKNFNTQWNKMTDKLNLAKPGDPQSRRVSYSSLRAWFITQRFYSDENINLLELSRAVGSSIGQLEARYVRLDMNKSYEHLTAGGWDSKDKEPIYKDGYYAGHDYGVETG